VVVAVKIVKNIRGKFTATRLRVYGQKKFAFLAIFLLTLFETVLKYLHVSQQANINRQQAKMTFQLACRKWLSHKDLEPASSYS